MTLKKIQTTYDRFVVQLAEKGEKLMPNQEVLASTILEQPVRSGKSWLIKRLAEFDMKDSNRSAT